VIGKKTFPKEALYISIPVGEAVQSLVNHQGSFYSEFSNIGGYNMKRSFKRVTLSSLLIVLLAISIITGGCASENDSAGVPEKKHTKSERLLISAEIHPH